MKAHSGENIKKQALVVFGKGQTTARDDIPVRKKEILLVRGRRFVAFARLLICRPQLWEKGEQMRTRWIKWTWIQKSPLTEDDENDNDLDDGDQDEEQVDEEEDSQ
jgi:hypothetical protein